MARVSSSFVSKTPRQHAEPEAEMLRSKKPRKVLMLPEDGLLRMTRVRHNVHNTVQPCSINATL